MDTVQDAATEATRFSSWRMLLGLVFTVFMVGSGILALKIVSIHGVVTTGSAFSVPIVFASFVLIGEVYGYGAARRILYITTGLTVSLAAIMLLAAGLPTGLHWVGALSVEQVEIYAPWFMFATATAILVAHSAMILALRFMPMLWHRTWLRIFILPVVAQTFGAPVKVILCYYKWLSPQSLIALSISRLAVAMFVSAMALPALYLMIGFVRKKENEEALYYAVRNADVVTAQQEQRGLAMADAISDGIFTVTGSDSIIRYVNPAGAHLFGYEPIQLIGKPLSIIQPQPMWMPHATRMRGYFDGNGQTLDAMVPAMPLCGVRSDGAEVPINVRYIHYRQNGQVIFTGIITPRGEGPNGTIACEAAI